MKRINQQAAKVMNKLIALCKALEDNHVIIDNSNGNFMAVSVELLQSVDIAGRKVTIYSVAHYYEQNGDLVPDPEMTFAVSDIDTMYIWPMTFNTSLGQKDGIHYSGNGWKINAREQADEAVFAGIWMKNIKFQQRL